MSEEKLLEGESVAIRCAHGDTVLYPVAELTETRYSTLWQSSRRHGTLPCGRAHGDTVLYPVAELTETRYSTLWQSSRRHGTLPCGRAHGDTVLYPVAELTETRYSTLWQSSRRHGTLPCGRAHGDTVLYPVAELTETRYSTLWQSSRRHGTLPCGRAHGDTVLYPVAELTETQYSTLWQSSRRHGTLPCGRAHGDTVLYTVAELEVEIGELKLAAVSKTLPMSMLVGTDIPQLLVLLQEELPEPVTRDSMREDALLVVTRAQAEHERRAGEAALQREEEPGALPRSLETLESQELEESAPVLTEEEQLSEFPVFGEDLFVTARADKVKKSKRAERSHWSENHTAGNDDEAKPTHHCHALDVSADEMKVLQDTDTTLQTLKRAAEDDPSEGGYFLRDGLLFRRWTPPGRDVETMAVDQLVLPLQCRDTVLNLAHSTPCAGHLGKDKTTNRISFKGLLYIEMLQIFAGSVWCVRKRHTTARLECRQFLSQ